MKIIVVLLFIGSIALNVGFLAGCRSLHDALYGAPCKFNAEYIASAKDAGKAELVRIADLLDIKTSGKTASDLSSDILYKLGQTAEVPTVFGEADFEKMAKDLNPVEKKEMSEYQRFISGLQGKKVIVIEPEK